MRKTNWLDRRIAAPGPYMCLRLSEEEYLAEMRKLKFKVPPTWVTPGADATVHHFEQTDGDHMAVVCLNVTPDRTAIEIAGLLVHEAVHIWQEYADGIGETHPGREQEAYAIQSIAQELMAEYARRTTWAT